ncbi:MAG: methyltransferase domain-containing protein [Pseudomonadota bacterium]
MSADGPFADRSAAEIERVLAFRAERSLKHFKDLAENGPVRECPICGYVGRFSPVRHKPSIWCPSCDSRPRHRLLKLWLDRGAIGSGARVLHFAAEPWLRGAIGEVAEYCTADLNDRFELQLDITRMALPDARFDVIIANHVLEHVDDSAALAEIARVLSPGGFAVLTVPLVEGWDRTLEGEWTEEEARILATDPDHKRLYGKDFRSRVAAAGLRFEEFTAEEPQVSMHGLHRGEKIFVAHKS